MSIAYIILKDVLCHPIESTILIAYDARARRFHFNLVFNTVTVCYVNVDNMLLSLREGYMFRPMDSTVSLVKLLFDTRLQLTYHVETNDLLYIVPPVSSQIPFKIQGYTLMEDEVDDRHVTNPDDFFREFFPFAQPLADIRKWTQCLSKEDICCCVSFETKVVPVLQSRFGGTAYGSTMLTLTVRFNEQTQTYSYYLFFDIMDQNENVITQSATSALYEWLRNAYCSYAPFRFSRMPTFCPPFFSLEAKQTQDLTSWSVTVYKIHAIQEENPVEIRRQIVNLNDDVNAHCFHYSRRIY